MVDSVDLYETLEASERERNKLLWGSKKSFTLQVGKS